MIYAQPKLVTSREVWKPTLRIVQGGDLPLYSCNRDTETSTEMSNRRQCKPGIQTDRQHEALLLLREWLILEIVGHFGLILLRQIGGTWWSWRTGGPFAYIDVSKAMLLGDAFWVVAVVCTSLIRRSLLTEWGRWLGPNSLFSARAWQPWLIPGMILGWVVLVVGDRGAAYILGLPGGYAFEFYHALFFGYVTARLIACTIQLSATARLIVHRCRRAFRADGPRPYLPVGIGAVAGIALICVLVYIQIFTRGGSLQTEWALFARN